VISRSRGPSPLADSTSVSGKSHSTGSFFHGCACMHCVSLSPRYAIGALATGQLTFAQTQLHKKVVLDVAMAAKSFGKSPLLGVCYDEIARRA
jgi:hypothetical protein